MVYPVAKRKQGRPPKYTDAQRLEVVTLAAIYPDMLLGEIAERTGVGYATVQTLVANAAKEKAAAAQTTAATHPKGETSVNEDSTLPAAEGIGNQEGV